ncbi:MAG: acyltransferase family protein [Sphingomonas sp.]
MTALIQDRPGARLHALDALRAGALMLGVAFHASLSFLPGPQIWVVRDVPSEAVATFGFVAHLFRMTLFFVIAGYFGRLLVERRGTAEFVRNRATRILAPLLAFWPLVTAGLVACFVWGAAAMNGGVLPTNAPPPPPITLASFPLTHLWFLYVLLIFYAAALAVRGLAGAVDRSRRAGGAIDAAMRALMASPIAPAVLAAPLAIALAAQPIWFGWGGIPTPDTGFVPNAAALAGYGTAFAFGWMMQRQAILLDPMKRWWPVHLAAAGALTLACLILLGATSPVVKMAGGTHQTVYALCYALAVWSWTFGLIGAALRFLTRERPAVRYLADASYWIYIVHLPVVMAMQVLVFALPLPALVKWALVVAASSLILIASYHLLVRHGWIGAWLNGRRLPWRRPAAALEMQTA